MCHRLRHLRVSASMWRVHDVTTLRHLILYVDAWHRLNSESSVRLETLRTCIERFHRSFWTFPVLRLPNSMKFVMWKLLQLELSWQWWRHAWADLCRGYIWDKIISKLFQPSSTSDWNYYFIVFTVAIPSVCRLSVTLVHPTQGVEPFCKISSPLCTLAILWPPCKILRR